MVSDGFRRPLWKGHLTCSLKAAVLIMYLLLTYQVQSSLMPFNQVPKAPFLPPAVWDMTVTSLPSMCIFSVCFHHVIVSTQIWGSSGGLLWCSTWTVSSSAADLCIWYVHAPVFFGRLPESGGAGGGPGLGQWLRPPKSQRTRWPEVAVVQSVGKESHCYSFKKKKGKLPWSCFDRKIFASL